MNHGGMSTRHWRHVRAMVFARDGHTCAVCGAYGDTVDHIVPLALGGRRYDPANLRVLCRRCNCTLGGRLGRERQLARRPPAPTGRRVWTGAINLEE